MRVGELIDVRKLKQVQKASVAAGKKPRLELGVVGISIGQEQSTGDTSRVNEDDRSPRHPRPQLPTLGPRVQFTSYHLWKKSLPKNTKFKHDVTSTKGKMESIENAFSSSEDFEGRAGSFDHDTSEGWIYKHYLDLK